MKQAGLEMKLIEWAESMTRITGRVTLGWITVAHTQVLWSTSLHCLATPAFYTNNSIIFLFICVKFFIINFLFYYLKWFVFFC